MNLNRFAQWVLLALLVAGSNLFGAKSHIVDTLYKADQTTHSGEIWISWGSFNSVEGKLIQAGALTTKVAAGVVDVYLEANDKATPISTYLVEYRLTGQAKRTERWYVPTSVSVLKIADLRSLPSGVQPIPGATGLGDPGSNGVVVRTALNTTVARIIDGTAGEIEVTDGSGVLGNPTMKFASNFDVSGKTSTKPSKTVTDLPATCSLGEKVFKTDAVAGQNVYGCTATNVWTLQTHPHANKTLLDTYAQTEADLADAVTKKHVAASAGTGINVVGQVVSVGVHSHQTSEQGGQMTDASLSAAVGLAKGGTNNNSFTAARCLRTSNDGVRIESAPADCGAGGGSGSTAFLVEKSGEIVTIGPGRVTNYVTGVSTVIASDATVEHILGEDTGTFRFYVDHNGGSPIRACLYGAGITITNYTLTGISCASGSSFPANSVAHATVAIDSGAWGTPVDLRGDQSLSPLGFSGGLTLAGDSVTMVVPLESKSGNTTKVVTMGAGTPAENDCAKWDANGNLIGYGAGCGAGGGGVVEQISLSLDGGGSVITTGIKAWTQMQYGCTVNSWTLLADQTGSIVIDIWKDSYANYPPTDADSITASAPPTISAALKATDATLTGWTTSITAGDVLMFNVDSATAVTKVQLNLKCTR